VISTEVRRRTARRRWLADRPFDVAEDEIARFRCSGKSPLPIFLLSFAVPSLALTLKRE
jgi:hypothetical protein